MAVDAQKLLDLAKLFAPYATLYAVGGYVRDKLLGINSYDIDVCSKLEVQRVKNILLNTEFVVSDKNLRMGTIVISNGNFAVEYTTFRVDSYSKKSGNHMPLNVTFTDNMVFDAKRRDFKCNAIYLNILSNKIVDLLGGIDDINSKILSTVDSPSEVFEADGLRILRLVRFASELGFEIEKQTFDVAKQNAWRVKDIASERIRDELKKIFIADTKHVDLNLKDAHIRGIHLLDELGLVDILLPELKALKGLVQPSKYHLYDAYNHSLKAYEVSSPSLRWAALLHDIGKAQAVMEHGNMHGHDEIGADMARSVCNRLMFSNEQTYKLCQLVRWHMVDINGNTSERKLRWFCAQHADIIEDLCALKDFDGIASAGTPMRSNRIRETYKKMKNEGIPFSIKALKIDGNDLVALGIEGKQRSSILNELWRETVLNPSLNDREKALEYVKRKV